MMLNRGGEPEIPGLACSAPVYRDGQFLGVLSTTFKSASYVIFSKSSVSAMTASPSSLSSNLMVHKASSLIRTLTFSCKR